MRKHSFYHPLVLLLLAQVVVAAFQGCRAERDKRPDRVVLITIDTLRADHVGAYGYPLDITPFIDSLADSGVAFGRALAHSSSTTPSHASMFTGLFPIQHSLHSNGLRLQPGFRTLAEAFFEEGYQTAAFVSTDAHFKSANLHRGFEVYDEPVSKGAGKKWRNKGKLPYRQANKTIDTALEWLAQVDGDKKVFLWVHLYDPHKKLRPPQRYRQEVLHLIEKIGDDHYRQALEATHGDLDFRKLYEKILLYDAEILFVDSELERLYRAMESARSRDLWVITSDHGQGLYGHDKWFGHVKQIYNSQILVPLILHYTNSKRGPVWIEEALAQHVDLVPTLGELIGFEISQPGSPLQGRSLAPYLAGPRAEQATSYSLAQSSPGLGKQMRRPDRSLPKYSLQSLEMKYILNEHWDDEFYNLRADPFERRNQLDGTELSDEEARLLATLVRMIATLTNTDVEAEMVDEATLDRLRALGYLQ